MSRDYTQEHKLQLLAFTMSPMDTITHTGETCIYLLQGGLSPSLQQLSAHTLTPLLHGFIDPGFNLHVQSTDLPLCAWMCFRSQGV